MIEARSREYYREEDRGYSSLCWVWQKSLKNGYGRISTKDEHGLAHKVFYEKRFGPVASDHTLHHLCRVPACANPDHLTPLPRGVHSRLHHPVKTHCKWGHLKTGRKCQVCANLYLVKWRRAKRFIAQLQSAITDMQTAQSTAAGRINTKVDAIESQLQAALANQTPPPDLTAEIQAIRDETTALTNLQPDTTG